MLPLNRFEKSGELCAHDTPAADGATQNRLVQHDPQFEPAGTVQLKMLTHPSGQSLIKLLLCHQCSADPQQRLGIFSGLQETRNDVRGVLMHCCRFRGQIHEAPGPVRKGFAVHMWPQIREQAVRTEPFIQQTCELGSGPVPCRALDLRDARTYDVHPPAQLGLRQPGLRTQPPQTYAE
jgi:hypothetical protein